MKLKQYRVVQNGPFYEVQKRWKPWLPVWVSVRDLVDQEQILHFTYEGALQHLKRLEEGKA